MNTNFLFKLIIALSIFLSYGCQIENSSTSSIIVKQNGEIILYGEKIIFENLKPLLVEKLKKVNSIPANIDIDYQGEVLMGLRSEIETEIENALAEARMGKTNSSIGTQVDKSKLVKQQVVIENVLFKKEKGTDCDQPDTLRNDCAIINFEYPVVQQPLGGLKKDVDKWVNTYLIGILTNGSTQHASNTTLEGAAKIFFDTREEYKGSVMYGAFVAECNKAVLQNNNKYLTLELTGYTFQGGAHGSSSARVTTFDLESGKQLVWNDLITDKELVKKLAEDKFREVRTDDFAKSFVFNDTFPFKLPENYGLVKDGIYFHYLPYEIGPYAMGSTTFILSFSELAELSKVKSSVNSISEVTDSVDSQDDPDLISIEKVIHDFYTWYDKFRDDEVKNISFTKVEQNHLSLDMPNLKKYQSYIKASGYISDVLLNNELNTLVACEKLWKNEPLDEPSSCLDYDRFTCTQEWDKNFWTQSPVTVEGLGNDVVTAIMSNNQNEQKFNLQKENGKWLITKIYCQDEVSDVTD